MSEDFRAWFELRSDHGIDHAQNLEPIAELAISLNLPQMVAGHVIATGTQVCTVKPAPALTDDLLVRVIPDTRIVETSSMLVAQALSALPLFDQIDQPSPKAIASAESETAAHKDAMAKMAAQVAGGDAPAPDASDPKPQAPAALTGAVAIPEHRAFDADERLELDQAIAAHEIDPDDRFAIWVGTTTVDDLIARIGDDRLLAKRILIAEEARGDARKTLVEKLDTILTSLEA